jgi:hypothetical protein
VPPARVAEVDGGGFERGRFGGSGIDNGGSAVNPSSRTRRPMKIVSHTPTQLILRETAVTLRVVGGLFFALGVGVIWLGHTQGADGEIGKVPVVIGCLIAAAGAAMVVLPARRTFAFSRDERICIIASQGVRGLRRETIPLDQIVDVIVDESSSSEGGSTYRVSMTLADQRRIPWTSYYTSGYPSKRAVVDLVRDFLRLEPNPSLGSGAPTVKTERELRRSRIGLALMGAFCSIFLVVGATMLVKEQRRLSLYQPVSATVLGTRVDEHSDSDGSTYEPVVVYRYRVGGREYTASRVTPLEESRGGRWASRVTARYRVGGTYTAYYDPANPEEAYLVRTRSVLPWAFVGMPLVAILFIAAAFRGTAEMTRASYRETR